MGFLDIDRPEEALRHGRDPARASTSTIEEGELPRARRPVGLRQVHAAQHDRRAGGDHRAARSRSRAASMNGVHPSKRDIAMVFQSYALYPNMTVGQNIDLRPGDARRAEARARQGAGRGRQDCCRSTICSTASRASSPAASASASPWAGRWCANPDVFLFDEPLSNLDAKLRVDMRTEIKRLHQKLKHHHRLRHPRPDRGDDAGHPDRGAEGRRRAAARHADGDLQHTRPTCSSRLHGLAGDEPHPGDASSMRERRAATPPSPTPTARRARLRFSPGRTSRRWDGQDDHPRHPPRGDHRPRRRRPQVAATSSRSTQPRRRDRAGRLRHLRHHDPRRQGRHRAHARRRRRRAGQVFAFAFNLDKAVSFDPATEDRIAP